MSNVKQGLVNNNAEPGDKVCCPVHGNGKVLDATPTGVRVKFDKWIEWYQSDGAIAPYHRRTLRFGHDPAYEQPEELPFPERGTPALFSDDGLEWVPFAWFGVGTSDQYPYQSAVWNNGEWIHDSEFTYWKPWPTPLEQTHHIKLDMDAVTMVSQPGVKGLLDAEPSAPWPTPEGQQKQPCQEQPDMPTKEQFAAMTNKELSAWFESTRVRLFGDENVPAATATSVEVDAAKVAGAMEQAFADNCEKLADPSAPWQPKKGELCLMGDSLNLFPCWFFGMNASNDWFVDGKVFEGKFISTGVSWRYCLPYHAPTID